MSCNRLNAVRDRQERGEDQGREDASVHHKVVGSFFGEIFVADPKECGFTAELRRRPAISEQSGALIVLRDLREAPTAALSARIGFIPLLKILDLRCGFHFFNSLLLVRCFRSRVWIQEFFSWSAGTYCNARASQFLFF
jgi:hypothetical protein